MSIADTYVRAWIDSATKERATEALEAMGLSISDAIRLLMLRIAGSITLRSSACSPVSAIQTLTSLPPCSGGRWQARSDLETRIAVTSSTRYLTGWRVTSRRTGTKPSSCNCTPKGWKAESLCRMICLRPRLRLRRLLLCSNSPFREIRYRQGVCLRLGVPRQPWSEPLPGATSSCALNERRTVPACVARSSI